MTNIETQVVFQVISCSCIHQSNDGYDCKISVGSCEKINCPLINIIENTVLQKFNGVNQKVYEVGDVINTNVSGLIHIKDFISGTISHSSYDVVDSSSEYIKSIEVNNVTNRVVSVFIKKGVLKNE